MKAKRFRINIDLGNSGMNCPHDVATAVEKIALAIRREAGDRGYVLGGGVAIYAPPEAMDSPTKILDGNGNTVGSWRFSR